MVRGPSWNKDTLEQLTVLYKKGTPLKKIAEILGRTPTAINKILERQNIRKRRPPRENEFLNIDFKEIWVGFPTIVAFLKYSGYSIYHYIHPANPKIQFLVNRFPCTTSQLLFLANRIRFLNHQPTFFVHGITEC